jgi:hypothetical protein
VKWYGRIPVVKMEATWLSESLVSYHITAWRQNSDDHEFIFPRFPDSISTDDFHTVAPINVAFLSAPLYAYFSDSPGKILCKTVIYPVMLKTRRCIHSPDKTRYDIIDCQTRSWTLMTSRPSFVTAMVVRLMTWVCIVLLWSAWIWFCSSKTTDACKLHPLLVVRAMFFPSCLLQQYTSKIWNLS